MIESTHGDLLKAQVEALVNTVNCVGVMGKGLALQFKQAYPENFRYYQSMCARRELKPGVLCVSDLGPLSIPRYIINFPTKRHWRDDSRLDDIQAGLVTLVQTLTCNEITSVAIPPLGCGNGNLSWLQVRPLIEYALNDLDIRVLLYEPN